MPKLRTVVITEANKHRYATCNARFNDTTKPGSHLYDRVTFEPVQTNQESWPLTHQSFCPACVLKMPFEDMKYVFKENADVRKDTQRYLVGMVKELEKEYAKKKARRSKAKRRQRDPNAVSCKCLG